MKWLNRIFTGLAVLGWLVAVDAVMFNSKVMIQILEAI